MHTQNYGLLRMNGKVPRQRINRNGNTIMAKRRIMYCLAIGRFAFSIDLYNLAPDSNKIARAREVIEYEMSNLNNDYWWWSDGLCIDGNAGND